MEHFVWIIRVQLLLCAVVTPIKSQGKQTLDGTIITSFFETFLKPFFRSTNIDPPVISSAVNQVKETSIEKLIRTKIYELKPLLEDNENGVIEVDDNLTLTGHHDTVVEFLPTPSKRSLNSSGGSNGLLASFKNNPLKDRLNKYKILREQIKKELSQENISAKTRTFIVNTLDDILAQMIESQCTWNPNTFRKFFKSNSTKSSLSRVQNMSKIEWKELRDQYVQYLTAKRSKENLFMNQFHEFFSTVINETDNLSDRYKIKCQLVQTNPNEKSEKHALRGQLESKVRCPNFKLCSDELKDFLADFYMYLNDTAVNTFRNYAAMYVRDFGVDSHTVVNIINKLGDYAQGIVNKVYLNEVKNLDLAGNKDKRENVRLMTNFINVVVSEIKSIVKANLLQQLETQRTKLFLTIKEDLVVNLEMDMENLANYYIDNFCSKFMLCNGRYESRKQGSKWTFLPKTNEEVYVKVQLSLDDQMKNNIIKSGLIKKMVKDREDHAKYTFKKKSAKELSQSNKKISLTRTTRATTDSVVRTRQTRKRHVKINI